jgi:hypothetical protein
MSRNKSLPGSRLVLYAGSLAGVLRTAERSLAEVNAPAEEIDPTTRAELRDVSAKWVFIAGLGVLLTLWATVVVIYPLFDYVKYERTDGQDPSKVLYYVPPQPPIPRNEDHEFRTLQEFQARERAEMESYRWVDRSKGVVAIPIERAMSLIVERGIPPTKGAGNQYYPPSEGSMRTGLGDKVKPEPR